MLVDLFEQMSKEEFELLLNQIKSSLAEHRKWLRLVNISIVSGVPLVDSSFIAEDSHLHCKFGLWLSQIFSDDIFRQSAFLKVDRLHCKFHKLVRELMVDMRAGHRVDLEKYVLFLDVQNEFFELVLSIFEFSVVNKNQFDLTTQLMNRRSADAILVHEHYRMKRISDSNCCIVLADIDNFKDFNDTYGHDVGDLVLRHCADIFNHAVRRHDTVARYGGEEFLFVMPDMEIAAASQIIERVREKLQQSGIIKEGKELGVTASFGVTQLCRDADIKESIKRADIALYYAKDHGENTTTTLDVFSFQDELCNKFEQVDSEAYIAILNKHCRVV